VELRRDFDPLDPSIGTPLVTPSRLSIPGRVPLVYHPISYLYLDFVFLPHPTHLSQSILPAGHKTILTKRPLLGWVGLKSVDRPEWRGKRRSVESALGRSTTSHCMVFAVVFPCGRVERCESSVTRTIFTLCTFAACKWMEQDTIIIKSPLLYVLVQSSRCFQPSPSLLSRTYLLSLRSSWDVQPVRPILKWHFRLVQVEVAWVMLFDIGKFSRYNACLPVSHTVDLVEPFGDGRWCDED
jgi:hypothetical protein